MEGFTASGTFNVPAGVTKVLVKVWSAGGGGGAGCSACLPGPMPEGGTGGGAGGYCEAIVNVTAGSAIPITIGTGGNGGFGDGANGTNGGASSFGAFVVVQGGNGGIHNSSGALGGFTSTCTCVSNISLSGQLSQSSSQMSTQVCEGGPGGNSPLGGGGGASGAALPFAFIAGKQGTNGAQPGGGGGGGGMYITGNSGAGGFGANGAIIVYY
ncbi:MAG: glycine-rich domain-containing protein [Bacteroidia bacterium]